VNRRPLTHWISHTFCGLALLCSEGCVHKIHVTPSPPLVAENQIAEPVQVLVPFLALEGADHMPGIALFEWPAKDLQAAAIDYLGKRQTFSSVGDEPENLTLTIKAWLTMRSRDAYVYKLRLESDLGPAGKPAIKSYIVEKEAIGSKVRWVTASDQDPIQQTVQAALDDLLQQIESYAPLYRKGSH
jgi:hypothetical protein